MPKKKFMYDKEPAYQPGLSTLLLWPLLSVGTTVAHICVRSGLLGAEWLSRESGIVAATGAMSVVMCIWLDILGKKSPFASSKATDYKFWGFALVVIGIGVSLSVHYAQAAIEKRADKMKTAVSSNVSSFEKEQETYSVASTNYKDCVASFKNISRRKAGQLTVRDACGIPPSPPDKKATVQDATVGVMDLFFAEAAALILLSIIAVTDLLIYGHGLKTVYNIAKGSYTQQRVRLAPDVSASTSLPPYQGRQD